MNIKNLLLSIFCLVFMSGLFSQTISPDYIDGHLYFKFKDSYRIDFNVNENTSIDYDQLPDLHYLFDKYNVTLITRPLLIFDDQKLARIIRLEFSDAQNIDLFIKELELNSDIEYAEKIPYSKKFITYNDPHYIAIMEGGIIYNFKWHLEKINAPQAWGIQTGSSSVKVAIVDNAVWGAHPDLNISSLNQCNFSSGTASPGNSSPPTSISQTTNCSQYTLYGGNCHSYNWSHGTHCAGLVGAINNNGIGISSIGGGVALMGVRTANNADELYYTSNGVSWAINNGAKIISMSYGSPSQSTSENNMFQTGVNNGVIFIAAAGNEGDESNYINYPAGYSTVIGVASINDDGSLSSFSQWGTGRADIAAPGGFSLYDNDEYYPNILSTTYCTNQLYRIFGISNFNATYYDGMQGTSMACPMVAGLAGLLASAYPDITFAQVKSCLQSTATALTIGSNQIGGQGYINAYAAVQCAQSLANQLSVNPPTLSYTASGGTQTVSVTSTINWTVSESCDWVTVSPTSGSNNGSFTVTTSANTGNSRTCTITISGTGVPSKTITVTQVAAPSLVINPHTLSYTSDDSSQTISVISNTNWTVSKDCNWITVSPIAGSNNGTFTVTASANTGNSRTCTIIVSGTGVNPQIITVNQAGSVGIETNYKENSLSLYPSPTSDYINIKANFIISQLQIIDIIGKVVLELDNLNHDFLNIYVANLPNSMYITKIASTDGIIHHRKFTKQ